MTRHALADTLEALSAATTPASAYQAVAGMLQRQGVSFANYVSMGTSDADPLGGALHFWTNMPASWMEEYARGGMAAHDYSVRKLLIGRSFTTILTGADYLKDMPDLKPGEDLVLQAARDSINMRAGFCGLLPEPTPMRVTGFMLAMEMPRRDTTALVTERGGLFALAMMALHERMVAWRALPSNDGAPVVLSVRERAVLEGMACGHTARRIGERLRLSDATVAQHVLKARRKLGARTGEQAMLKAILAGLVTP